MQAITSYITDPQAREALLALNDMLSMSTQLFHAEDAIAQQASAGLTMQILLNTLPGNALWLQHAPSLVPLLREFASELATAGDLAKSVPPETALRLGGRMYDRATSIVLYAAKLMAPGNYPTFTMAYYKARGVT